MSKTRDVRREIERNYTDSDLGRLVSLTIELSEKPLTERTLNTGKAAISCLVKRSPISCCCSLEKIAINASGPIALQAASALERIDSGHLKSAVANPITSEPVRKQAVSFFEKGLSDCIEKKDVDTLLLLGEYASEPVRTQATSTLESMFPELSEGKCMNGSPRLKILKFLAEHASELVRKQAVLEFENILPELIKRRLTAYIPHLFTERASEPVRRAALAELEKILPEFIEKEDTERLSYLAQNAPESVRKKALAELERIESSPLDKLIGEIHERIAKIPVKGE